MNIFEGLKSVPNIHPLFVHFPIALLLVATLLFIISSFKTDDELRSAAKWNLIIGSLFAVVTVLTGFIAANTLPHNEEIHNAMKIHRNIMIPVTLLSLLFSGYIYIQKEAGKIKNFTLFLAGLVLMSGLLVLGADFGGKMVFKYGAGTELFIKMYPDAEKKHEHNNGEHNNGEHEHGRDQMEQEAEHTHGHDEHEHGH